MRSHALQSLTADGWLLFATRFIRLFAYGALSVVLVFYLVGLGLTESQTGLLLTRDAGRRHARLALSHDARRSDRPPADADVGATADGRRRARVRVRRISCGCSSSPARSASISPSGDEVGPFLPIEQAALSHVVRRSRPDRGVRLVHARRLAGDRARRAGRRIPHPAPCSSARRAATRAAIERW